MSRAETCRMSLCLGLFLLSLGCGGGGSAAPEAGLDLTSTPATTAIVAHAYRYVASASSPQGGSLSYTLVASPSGATLAGSTIDWTPSAAVAGTSQAFRLKVGDGSSFKEQSWSVAVSANLSPSFTSTPPSEAKEGHSYIYTLAATDPNGDLVQFQDSQLPAGASLSGGQLTWVPSASEVGQAAVFKIKALDGFGGTQDQAWSVTPSANALPVMTSQPPQDMSFVQGASVFDYMITSTDSDNDPVTFSLIQAPAGAVIVNGLLHWQPTPAQERVPQTFQIRASDGHGGTVDQQWTKAYSGVVRGTWSDTYLSPSGVVAAKQDTNLAAFGVYALVPTASGGFEKIFGSMTVDGSWRISGIPPGSYWLNAGPRGFIWTEQSQIDLGKGFLGRADAQASSDPVSVELTLTGLDSWTDLYGMRWLVANHATQISFFSSYFTANAPAPGDTALVSAVIPGIPYAPLVDASKLDELMLLQPGQEVQENISTETIHKVFTTSTLTQKVGTTALVSGVFAKPSSSNISLDWNASREIDYLDQVHPGSLAGQPGFLIATQPGGFSPGLMQSGTFDADSFYLGHPLLVNANANTYTRYTQTLSFGDPYPATWPRIYISHTAFPHELTFNGITGTDVGTLMTVSDSPGTPADPLQLIVSPVRNPTINGRDLFQEQTGVGTHPTIAWGVPSLGSPVLYQVRIREVGSSGSGLTFGSVWSDDLTIFGTSVQIPEGILHAGSAYVINIRAVSTGNGDAKNAPFRMALPFGMADCLSAVIRP
ncbi:MAG TPA: hypothetical protein VJ486_11780 [Geothrix sp.]|nr:hypothetical protein [Geothrix sp.]